MKPIAFREYVLKIHSRCNLACSYCYMYQLADRSAANDVPVMSWSIFHQACYRIAEHLEANQVASAKIVFHGGEPLLSGVSRLVEMAKSLRKAIDPIVNLRIAVQTNGILLNRPGIEALADAGVSIGVSLDGDRRANDLHRRYRDGRSSFDQVDRALHILRDHPQVFGGILSVVDLRNDPVATVAKLSSYEPPRIDFLLPHANWSALPVSHSPTEAPYGRWLAAAFDEYYGSSAGGSTRVRLFDEIMRTTLGGASRTEAIGLSPAAAIVINVDGAYEQIDTLRSTYPGAHRTSLNVFEDPLNVVMNHPAIRARQMGIAGLAIDCVKCPLLRVCGGGYYAHRYREGNGFLNPSVYCADLFYLISHIASHLKSDVGKIRTLTNSNREV